MDGPTFKGEKMKACILILGLLYQSVVFAADKKVTDLSLWPSTSWGLTDVFPIVDLSGDATKKTRVSDFDFRYVVTPLTTNGDMIYRAAGVPARLAIGSANTVQVSTGTAPSWALLVNANIDAAAAIADTKLGTISTASKVSNSATTATSANTASAIVARDGSGNFTAGTVTAAFTGNLTGNVTGNVTGAVTGNASTATALAADPADCSANTYATSINASGTLGCASITNASTTAVSTATNSTIVLRDGSGNFSAGTVTAALTGTASGNLTYSANNHGVLLSSGTNAATVIAPDASATKVLKSGGSSADPTWLAYDNANTVSTLVFRDGSGNFTAGTITAALTGNASTATALAANPSDCSADTYATTIAASGNLTCGTVTNAGLAGSIAASKLIGSDIATVGTITSGTWTGTTIAIANGGTGQTSKAAAFDALQPMTTGGDIIYGGASGTGTRLANGSAGQVLTSAGTTLAPTWTTVLTNPMTTGGDVIYGGAAGVPTRLANGSVNQVLTSGGTTVAPTWTTISANLIDPKELLNCSIASSVGSNALTVALKDAGGSDPSGGSPCKIAFRSATAATGTASEVSTTGAGSVVVSNGSALGCIASTVCTVYVYAINNAGTVELGVVGGAQLDEGTRQTSTAEGGAGASDSTGVLYSTSARTTIGVRLLGRLTITPGASFAWSAAATEISNVPFNDRPMQYAGLKFPVLYTADIAAASTCTVSNESSEWINGNGTSGGTGQCQLTVQTGIFSATPRCWCTANNGAGNSQTCLATSTSSTAVAITGLSGAGTANIGVFLFCVGTRE